MNLDYWNLDGLGTDADGSLYIADSYNQRVRKVNPAGIITTIAGNGTQGFAGDGAPATSARLNSPSDVAADSLGNLYIADYRNDRIRKVDPSGTITTLTSLHNPVGVASTARVVCTPPPGARFGALPRTAPPPRSCPGSGRRKGWRSMPPATSMSPSPATQADFCRPSAIAVDADGNVYVGDRHWGTIDRISPAGIVIRVAGDGECVYPENVRGAEPVPPPALCSVNGLAVDADHNLYFSDGSEIGVGVIYGAAR